MLDNAMWYMGQEKASGPIASDIRTYENCAPERRALWK